MEKIKELIKVCNWMNASGFSPATSGNYSLRHNQNEFWVSASGVDKGNLQVEDFILMNTNGEVFSDKKVSDEAGIHARILELYPQAECVLHAHSIANTVVSLKSSKNLFMQGYEMQKAFVGNKDHKKEIEITILENNQNIQELAQEIKVYETPCFLIKGHGVYVWGKSISEAKRHLEGIEFLLQCQLELLKCR